MGPESGRYEEELRLAWRSLGECQKHLTECDETQRAMWAREVGASVTEEMLTNRDSAERCLEHAELKVRIVALGVLEDRWKVPWEELGRDTRVRRLWQDLAGPVLADAMLHDRGVAERCLEDSDDNVRLAAMIILRNHWGVLPYAVGAEWQNFEAGPSGGKVRAKLRAKEWKMIPLEGANGDGRGQRGRGAKGDAPNS